MKSILISGSTILEIPAKFGIYLRLSGDEVWPAYIFLSLVVWPVFLPIGVLIKHYLINKGYIAYAFVGSIGVGIG